MQIWPAVEIRSGKCVRPTQGDYRKRSETETVYGENPADMAIRWINDGATGLHIVDLDAALGEPGNFDSISQIASQADIPLQVGGGIRDEPTIKKYLEIGIDRLVVGTRAMKDPQWIIQMSEKYPHRILLGLDSCQGVAVSSGRQEKTNLSAIEFAQRMASRPFAGVVFTDIAKSGNLEGPNFEAQKQLRAAINIPVIACGGIATVDDATKLAALDLDGCVIGRALYEGRVTLAETQTAVRQASLLTKANRDSGQPSDPTGVSTS